MVRSLSMWLAAGSVSLALSGCAPLERLTLWHHRSDRKQIFQFYGECLDQRRGELLTIAKFCGSVADTRYTREKNTVIDRCPLSEYLPCIQP